MSGNPFVFATRLDSASGLYAISNTLGNANYERQALRSLPFECFGALTHSGRNVAVLLLLGLLNLIAKNRFVAARATGARTFAPSAVPDSSCCNNIFKVAHGRLAVPLPCVEGNHSKSKSLSMDSEKMRRVTLNSKKTQRCMINCRPVHVKISRNTNKEYAGNNDIDF